VISCLIFSAVAAATVAGILWDTGPFRSARGTLSAVLACLWLWATRAARPGHRYAWRAEPATEADDITPDDLDLDELLEALADRAGDAPVPGDGEPLSFREVRALAAVEMDALIGIGEPVYPAQEASDG
jgi:hypothetical protein